MRRTSVVFAVLFVFAATFISLDSISAQDAASPTATVPAAEPAPTATTPIAPPGPEMTISIWPRLFGMTLFLLASLAVLMKAEYAPLATMPQLAKVRENMHARNQTVFGGVLIVIACYLIYRGFFFFGLIGNLVLIAAGLYLALGFFERRPWWTPELSATLRKFALPIGFACAGLAIWRLLFVGVIDII